MPEVKTDKMLFRLLPSVVTHHCTVTNTFQGPYYLFFVVISGRSSYKQLECAIIHLYSKPTSVPQDNHYDDSISINATPYHAILNIPCNGTQHHSICRQTRPSSAECHFLLMINPVNESEVEGVKIKQLFDNNH